MALFISLAVFRWPKRPLLIGLCHLAWIAVVAAAAVAHAVP